MWWRKCSSPRDPRPSGAFTTGEREGAYSRYLCGHQGHFIIQKKSGGYFHQKHIAGHRKRGERELWSALFWGEGGGGGVQNVPRKCTGKKFTIILFTGGKAGGAFSTWTGSFSGFCLSLGYRIPCGLFTPGSFYPVVFANFLVLKDLAKWRDFHFSRIFRRLLTYEGWHWMSSLLLIVLNLCCI
jgi:hypothetical protein